MFFDLIKKQEVGGEIALYDLQDWWLNSLSENERKEIRTVYKPMGSTAPIDYGKYLKTKQTRISPLGFLAILSGWFNNSKDYQLALKIITKAEEYIKSDSDIIDLHYFYPSKIRVLNRGEPDNSSIEKIIECCQKQIYLAPLATEAFRKEYKWNKLPVHEGYDRLISIFEREGKYNQAMHLAEQARKQGWNGDWDKLISKFQTKLNTH